MAGLLSLQLPEDKGTLNMEIGKHFLIERMRMPGAFAGEWQRKSNVYLTVKVASDLMWMYSMVSQANKSLSFELLQEELNGTITRLTFENLRASVKAS